jgi:DNA polymerase
MQIEDFESVLYEDVETFSPTPIKNGIGAYFDDPESEILLFQYAFDDEPVTVIDLTAGEKIPKRVLDAQRNPKILKVMHNSAFDRRAIYKKLKIKIPVGQIWDTMVQALAHSLPGGLSPLCDIYKLPVDIAKDKDGKTYIGMFCKPRPKRQKVRRYTSETHPKEWKGFKKYAALDIDAMRALMPKLPRWNYQGAERELWNLDQAINDRGFLVDQELARGAIRAIERAQIGLAKRTHDITEGKVEKATQRDKLLKHIIEHYGVWLPDMKKATLEKLLGDDNLPRGVRDLIAIRLEASMTSTGKYKKLLECVSRDGRLRYTMQFCGASRTSRWAGRLFQPQNLLRPQHKADQIEGFIDAIKADALDFVTDNVMSATGSCARGAIVAPHGRKLCVSDLSNIEGRAAAWLADEKWKLKAFHDYDLGIGADLYRLAYATAFDMHVDEVDDGEDKGPQRQVGKVLELFMQYEGGVGAFLTGAATYKIDLDDLARIAWPNIPEEIRDKAERTYEWMTSRRRSTFGLEKKTYLVCDSLKLMYRAKHPAISSYWKDLGDRAREAIMNPGVPVKCRKVTFVRKGAWLRMKLPSGRTLQYAAPRVSAMTISYMGQNQFTRKWKRIDTYGGKFFENLCQKIARDVMADNMGPIEDAGYDTILTVHDELLTEADDDKAFSAKHLSEMLSTNPPWSKGLPLAAGGFEAYRYRKD